MNRRLTALGWTALMAPTLVWGAAENLLPNAGFEQGRREPAGWTLHTVGGAQGACTLGTAVFRTGKQAFRFHKTSGRGYYVLELKKPVHVRPGRRYEVRGYVHVSAAAFGARTYFLVSQYPEDQRRYLPPNLFSSYDQRWAIRCRPGEWSVRSTVFTARPDTAFVQIGIVVTGNPSDLVWDDLYLGPPLQPTYKPPRLTPPDLVSKEEVYRRLASRADATGEIRRVGGRPRLFIAGKPVPPLFHLMCFWRPFTSYNADFRRAGVRVHVCPIPFAPYLRDGRHLWEGDGLYDFGPADEVLLYALRGDPDGYLVVDFCLIGAYPGWGDQHPDEVCQDSRGLKAIGRSVHNSRYGGKLKDPQEFWCPSYYSAVYRQDGEALIRAYVAHLRRTPLFKAVVGFSLTGGDDGQFSLWRRAGPEHVPDYSPAAQRGFVAYLKQRYKSVEELRRAWNDSTVDFTHVTLPSPEERSGAGRIFRDPRREARVADYTRFLSVGTCDLVRAFGRAAKEAARKPVFCTTYWGAHLMGVSVNHMASFRLLTTPEIDILHAPAGYGPWRRPGMPGVCNTTPASLRLHNKLFLQELDLRTFTRGFRNAASRYFLAWAADADEFRAIHRRETGMMQAWGMGAWYYDMAGGWFHDKRIMRDIAAVRDAYREEEASAVSWHPDLAVIADEESTNWVGDSARSLLYASLNRVREPLALCGVPYDLFVLADLERPELLNYKMYVFLDAYRLTTSQVRYIEQHLKRAGKVLVWVFAPGYVSDDGLSLAQTCRLTGMHLRLASKPTALQCVAVKSGDPLARELLPRQGTAATACKFWVDDSTTTVLARYEDGGEPAIAARRFADWRSLYVGSPGGLGPGLLHNAAQWAGAYVCTSPGDAVYMNARFLCVHGVQGGQRTFRLPRPATVTDMLTGRVLARDAGMFTTVVPLQGTRWFRLR